MLNHLGHLLRSRTDVANERAYMTVITGNESRPAAKVWETYLIMPEPNDGIGVTSRPPESRALRISKTASILTAASQTLASPRSFPGHILRRVSVVVQSTGIDAAHRRPNPNTMFRGSAFTAAEASISRNLSGLNASGSGYILASRVIPLTSSVILPSHPEAGISASYVPDVWYHHGPLGYRI